MLKWPNDLMLAGGKVGGILLERSSDRIVAGFGVNLATAPGVPGRRTAAVGAAMGPEAFAPLLAASFARVLDTWRSREPGRLAGDWLARAHPLGTRLTVHVGGNDRVSGEFDGLEPDGALRLRVGDRVDVIRAGDVEL